MQIYWKKSEYVSIENIELSSKQTVRYKISFLYACVSILLLRNEFRKYLHKLQEKKGNEKKKKMFVVYALSLQ